ncbi:MAG: hypothetical protein DRI83_09790 [Bacteroidetes bacterium]|nr:MAG: hypothetical protein DRI83_09790 [Bacteroidota bacterium]
MTVDSIQLTVKILSLKCDNFAIMVLIDIDTVNIMAGTLRDLKVYQARKIPKKENKLTRPSTVNCILPT